MKNLILFSTFFISIFLYSQDSDTTVLSIEGLNLNKTKAVVFSTDTDSPYTLVKAKEAIEKDELVLVNLIGFSGAGNMNLKQAQIFAEKYNIQLESLGCVRFWDVEEEDIPGFNNEIINFLCLKYGLQVRIEFNDLHSKPPTNEIFQPFD